MNYQIIHGDCVESMRSMPDASVDSVVTDPPYGLSFMGRKWDVGVPAVEVFIECLRVLKPGGHLLAFGGTRTSHRLVCAIEDAGFEIRDTIAWVYGSGFPKSRNVGKEVEAFEGWGTALKPAMEPICVARKPLAGTVAANALAHGTGVLNIDGCRIEGIKGTPASPRRAEQDSAYGDLSKDPGTGSGWDSSVGRWPANLIHDGSDEVLEAFPSARGQAGAVGPQYGNKASVNTYGEWGPRTEQQPRIDSSTSAARFFYCAKASKADRTEAKQVNNNHPTVKPTDLMRYLCRLVTPPGGTVLDPFMGSGSTGKAATMEGFGFIGIEADAAYVEIAEARVSAAYAENLPDWLA